MRPSRYRHGHEAVTGRYSRLGLARAPDCNGLPNPRPARGSRRWPHARARGEQAARVACAAAAARGRDAHIRPAHRRALGRAPARRRGEVAADADLPSAQGAGGRGRQRRRRPDRHARAWLSPGHRSRAARLLSFRAARRGGPERAGRGPGRVGRDGPGGGARAMARVAASGPGLRAFRPDGNRAPG